jgi:hypothetical protein
MTVDELKKKNKSLEAWIDDLQSGMYINCVYCGHRYGPNSGSDTKDFNLTMRKTLEQHIQECPKHPLFLAKQKIIELECALSKAYLMIDELSLRRNDED